MGFMHDLVAVALGALVGMAGGHRPAPAIPDNAGEQARMVGPVAKDADSDAGAGAFGAPLLDIGPEIQRDDGFMLAWVGSALMY